MFLDGVRTHHTNLVGALNQGWTVAKSLLGFERIFLGSPKLPEYGLQVLETVARARGVFDDPVFNDKFVALKLLKIWASETSQRIADLIIDTAGPFGGMNATARIGETAINALAPFYKARVQTIYGGSSEIQRNILARQVLELPG